MYPLKYLQRTSNRFPNICNFTPKLCSSDVTCCSEWCWKPEASSTLCSLLIPISHPSPTSVNSPPPQNLSQKCPVLSTCAFTNVLQAFIVSDRSLCSLWSSSYPFYSQDDLKIQLVILPAALPPTSFKSPSAASQRSLRKDELKTAPGPCAVGPTHFISHPPSHTSCSLQRLPSFQPAMTPSLQACAPLCRLENHLSSPLDRINSQASFRCQLRSHFPRKSSLITHRIKSNLPILSAKSTSFLSSFPPLLLFTFCGCHLLHQTGCFLRAGTVSSLVYHFISST